MLMAVAGFQTARLAHLLLGAAFVPRGSVAVFSGRGNNGGDGLVAARHLALWGVGVRCLCMGAPGGAVQPDLASAVTASGAALKSLAPGGLQVQEDADWALEGVDLIIDALLGTGAAGAPRGEIAAFIRRINRSSATVLAVDLPSGLDADSGVALGDCVRADHTLMMGVAKLGCEQLSARHWVGHLWTADIGIPKQCYLNCELEPPSGLGPDPFSG
jgi:NAD(P)H-hydrate epimerase